jgi:hypothetical protein
MMEGMSLDGTGAWGTASGRLFKLSYYVLELEHGTHYVFMVLGNTGQLSEIFKTCAYKCPLVQQAQPRAFNEPRCETKVQICIPYRIKWDERSKVLRSHPQPYGGSVKGCPDHERIKHPGSKGALNKEDVVMIHRENRRVSHES